jgi:hypothetical protein
VTWESAWHLWFPLQHWLAIHTGTDDEGGPFYGFFSGFGSDFGEYTLAASALAVWKRFSCHTWWCPRHGHYDFTDLAAGLTYKLCRHCHPAHPGHRLTRRRIHRIHHANRQGGT